MPDIVSNTTPLISLLKISRLEILKDLYSEICIPQAVYQEIEAGKNKDYYRDLSSMNWIKIKKIKNDFSVNYFLDLDAGEAESIILATELGAELIIIDEKIGRFHAKHAGLKVTGTVGVLLKAKKAGLIQELKPLLIEMTEKNVWLSEKLIDEVCKLINE